MNLYNTFEGQKVFVYYDSCSKLHKVECEIIGEFDIFLQLSTTTGMIVLNKNKIITVLPKIEE